MPFRRGGVLTSSSGRCCWELNWQCGFVGMELLHSMVNRSAARPLYRTDHAPSLTDQADFGARCALRHLADGPTPGEGGHADTAMGRPLPATPGRKSSTIC